MQCIDSQDNTTTSGAATSSKSEAKAVDVKPKRKAGRKRKRKAKQEAAGSAELKLPSSKLDDRLAEVYEKYPKLMGAYEDLGKYKPKCRMMMGHHSVDLLAELIAQGLKRLTGRDDIILLIQCCSLMETLDKYRQKYAGSSSRIWFAYIPVEIVISKWTGQHSDICLEDRRLRHFGAALGNDIFPELGNIIVKDESMGEFPLVRTSGWDREKGRCRCFDIRGLLLLIQQELERGIEATPASGRDGTQPAALDDEISKNRRTYPKHVWDYIQFISNTQFGVDTEWAAEYLAPATHQYGIHKNPDWKTTEKGREIYFGRVTSALVALRGLDLTQPVQYHSTWHLCSTGRVWNFGLVGLPKPLRRALVRTTKPYHIVVNVDLISCQLVALCELLECHESMELLKEVMDRGEKIWNYICPPGLDVKEIKPALKIFLYSFCFGMAETGLLRAVNDELAAEGSQVRLKQEDIDAILSSELIGPLRKARREFFDKYSIDYIKRLMKDQKGKLGRKIHKNALGMPFNLIEHAEKYLDELRQQNDREKAQAMAEGRKVRLKQTNQDAVARQFLAHLAQGAEQAIMQSYEMSIVDGDKVALLSPEHDGAAFEVHFDYVEDFIGRSNAWLAERHPNHKFEFGAEWWPVAMKTARLVAFIDERDDLMKLILGYESRWGQNGWMSVDDSERYNLDPRGYYGGRTSLWDGERFAKSHIQDWVATPVGRG